MAHALLRGAAKEIMAMNTQDAPPWWTRDHASAWERVREAVRRDWEQTKHDLALEGGHELNQGVSDTVKQALGKENIPTDDRPNPPKVIGSWDDVEAAVEYGYGARRTYGVHHPSWSQQLEAQLKQDWRVIKTSANRTWEEMKRWVRHGYEYKGQH
jgi:hypothetical protein